jgi:hypothetical protein
MLGAVLTAGCANVPSDGGGAGGSGGGDPSCPADLPKSCPPDAAGYKATIAPMFDQLCVACHKPGGQSVHYLRNYAEVAALAGPVLDQVYACKMPPAASYSMYPPLTLTQREELLGWLVCGAPDD